MLEYHSHMTAVNIDIHLHISNIHAVEDNASSRRILHTIQASEEGTFSGTGRTEHNYNVPFVDGDIDALQNFCITEAFFQINYVYHSSSGSFPVI